MNHSLDDAPQLQMSTHKMNDSNRCLVQKRVCFDGRSICRSFCRLVGMSALGKDPPVDRSTF